VTVPVTVRDLEPGYADAPGTSSEVTVGGLSGTRVLVTGADGFIGSHLVQRLVAEGADVRALCLYTSDGGHGWLESLPREERDGVDVHLGDIRDGGAMRDVVAGRELVFHLAALIAIPYSYQAPRSFVDTNVIGTQNVLEAVRAAGARMINTSTSEVYGTPDDLPIRETHPLKGQSPYSATKIAADKLCEAYALSFGTRVATLRPFNTYGPRQSLRAVIPTVLAQLLAGADRIHLGSLSPRRDFTFVEDTVEGFVRAALAELEPGELVQLGTGHDVSIGELVEVCQEVTGASVEVTTDEARIRPAGSEVEVLLSDPARAAERLNWRPTVSLSEGLRRTASWLEERGLSADAAGRYHR
jgi:NAD dependent epimerase/dehydratase